MDVKADLASTVHLMRLAIKLRQLHLNGSRGIRGRDLELEVEFELDVLVNVPALAMPPRE